MWTIFVWKVVFEEGNAWRDKAMLDFSHCDNCGINLVV